MKFLVVLIAALSVACVSSRSIRPPRLDGRIVGGTNTTIEEYPYQISLEYNGSHRCGGSIANASIIITAAHCVEGVQASRLKIRAGSSTKSSGGVLVQVKSLKYHEQYNPNTIDFDIAVLFLEKPLNYSKSIRAVPLPNENEILKVNSSAVVTGWGTLSSGGSSPKVLQRVSVPIVDQGKCEAAYKPNKITPQMVCAGRLGEGGKDSCQGDSGGPLVNNGKLHGVVSWGRGCASRNYPGVYSRVTALRAWVRKNAGL